MMLSVIWLKYFQTFGYFTYIRTRAKKGDNIKAMGRQGPMPPPLNKQLLTHKYKQTNKHLHTCKRTRAHTRTLTS